MNPQYPVGAWVCAYTTSLRGDGAGTVVGRISGSKRAANPVWNPDDPASPREIDLVLIKNPRCDTWVPADYVINVVDIDAFMADLRRMGVLA